MEYLYIVLIGLVVLAICKLLFNLKIRKLITLVLNIVLGIIVLWLVNTFGGPVGIYIPINILTALLVGLGGLPGVILLIILSLVGII